jgi:hypothetical protein
LKLAVLTLEDMSQSYLPEFLKIAYEIRGKKTFDKYLDEVKKEDKSKHRLLSENKNELLYNVAISIPLIGVLNSNL